MSVFEIDPDYATNYHQKHKERLQRIAARAVPDPLAEPRPQPKPRTYGTAPPVVIPPKPDECKAWLAAEYVVLLKDRYRLPGGRIPLASTIINAVSKHFEVSRVDLMSSRREAKIVRPRQIAMFMIKKLTVRSLPEIGRNLGGRDHTTVLHAVRKISSILGDTSISDAIFAIAGKLSADGFDVSPLNVGVAVDA